MRAEIEITTYIKNTYQKELNIIQKVRREPNLYKKKHMKVSRTHGIYNITKILYYYICVLYYTIILLSEQ